MIQSVQRAARILGLFNVSQPRLTLTELTEGLGISKATVHRYTVALRQAGLLRYDRTTNTFTLGPRIISLGAAAREGLSVIGIAASYMDRVVAQTSETVVLSVWDSESPVVVRVHDNPDRVVRVTVRLGARLSNVDSAQGRVFCALLDEAAETLTPAQRRDPLLTAELEAIRLRKVATNTRGPYGVRTIGVPVYQDDKVIAVMAIVGTLNVPDDVNSPQAQALEAAARELSDALGLADDGSD